MKWLVIFALVIPACRADNPPNITANVALPFGKAYVLVINSHNEGIPHAYHPTSIARPAPRKLHDGDPCARP